MLPRHAQKIYDGAEKTRKTLRGRSLYTYFNSEGTNVKIISNDAYIILYNVNGVPVHSVRSTSTSSGSSLSEWKNSTKVESKLGSAGVFVTTLEDMCNVYGASYYIVFTRK